MAPKSLQTTLHMYSKKGKILEGKVDEKLGERLGEREEKFDKDDT